MQRIEIPIPQYIQIYFGENEESFNGKILRQDCGRERARLVAQNDTLVRRRLQQITLDLYTACIVFMKHRMFAEIIINVSCN